MKLSTLAVATVLVVLLMPFASAATADAHVVRGRCPTYEPALRRAGLPVAYFSRIMYRESRCQVHAVNRRSGALSLLQIMPAHARGGRWGTCRQTYAQLRTAAGNIACAARLYRIAGTQPWRTTR